MRLFFLGVSFATVSQGLELFELSLFSTCMLTKVKQAPGHGGLGACYFDKCVVVGITRRRGWDGVTALTGSSLILVALVMCRRAYGNW